MSDKPKKPGMYRLGSGFIWALAMGAMGWYMGDGLWSVLGAAFTGLISGWGTATLLGFFARGGARTTLMMIAGLVIGVCVASGAMAIMTSLPMILLRGGAFEMDWEEFWTFVLSAGAIPAAVLGLLTGFYIRGKFAKTETP